MAATNRRRALLGGILVAMLVLVAAVNLKTFVFNGDGGVSPLRARGAPTPPADLDRLVENVLNREDAPTIRVAVAEAPSPGAVRDPFRRGSRPRTVRSETSGRRPDTAYQCTAVITEGRRPTALIDGRPYVPGEICGDLRILRILPHGVLIRDPRGRERVLEVVDALASHENFRITIDAREDNRAHHRDGTDGSEHERNDG